MLVPAMIQAQSSAASATLQGAVRDAKARPVAGATVYLQVKDGGQTLSAPADAAGNYRFSGLREGVYMLRVEVQGFGQATFGPCVSWAEGSEETRPDAGQAGGSAGVFR